MEHATAAEQLEASRRAYVVAQVGKKVGLAAVVFFMVAFAIAPIIWMAISSFQTESEILSVPPHWIPENPFLGNYKEIFLRRPMDVDVSFDKKMAGYSTFPTQDVLPGMLNSVIIGLSVVVLNLAVGGLAAYAFARFRFKMKQWLFYFVLASRIVPDIAIVIPFYVMIRWAGLLDTHFALILTYMALSLPLTIFILVMYLETIPRDLDRAAKVDGCSRFQTLRKVIVPISTPAIVAAALFAFLACWNEFLFSLVITSTIKVRTLPVVISDFASSFTISYARQNASSMMAAIPPVILVVIFHKYFVRGLTAGAVKG